LILEHNTFSVPASGHLVCATLITGVYDVNRRQSLEEDQPALIQKWCTSLQNLSLSGVIFHNTFSEKTVQGLSSDKLHFIRVNYNNNLNPNVFRYIVYDAFLKQYTGKNDIKKLFVTDISDVEAVVNPFIQPLFINNPNAIFCGDELTTMSNEWMIAHGEHLRLNLPGYANFEEQYQNDTLLNCGIIGGSFEKMSDLMQKLADLHSTYTQSNNTKYTLDMGAFNYLARTVFGSELIHGAPVNTIFKGYEADRKDCWFRHK
jgi:hypothetical protein